METKRIDAESPFGKEQALNEGAALLRQGEVVAFPTETVYGLGANALNSSACAKIFVIKGRPADNPLIVHVASVEGARKAVREWPKEADICASEFWPGPLTLVLPKADSVPEIVSGGLQTVAVRIPSHPLALDLIARSRCPIAAPSANISGKPSPTEAEHVWHDLRGKIPLLIDGGKCKVGLESTVLDLTGEIPLILRPGGVTREQLKAVLGKVNVDNGVNNEAKGLFQPKSPGMKYRHYAPQAEIILICGEIEEKAEQFARKLSNKKPGKRIALLCLEETASILSEDTMALADLVFILGSGQKPTEAASRLFEGLRLCDQESIEIILAEGMLEQGIWLAFMNRLQKAAGKKGDLEIV